jgi:hypothetical protein
MTGGQATIPPPKFNPGYIFGKSSDRNEADFQGLIAVPPRHLYQRCRRRNGILSNFILCVVFCLILKMATAPMISAGVVAAAAYLNAKLSISIDLQQLSYDREWGARLGKRMQELGDTCTIYRIFDLADPDVEALWFEGRTWKYWELKSGRLALFFSRVILTKFLF